MEKGLQLPEHISDLTKMQLRLVTFQCLRKNRQIETEYNKQKNTFQFTDIFIVYLNPYFIKCKIILKTYNIKLQLMGFQ